MEHLKQHKNTDTKDKDIWDILRKYEVLVI